MSEDRATQILDEVDADFVSDLWAKGVNMEEIALLLKPKKRQTKKEVMRLLGIKARKQGVN